jgi:hypothetical protein
MSDTLDSLINVNIMAVIIFDVILLSLISTGG